MSRIESLWNLSPWTILVSKKYVSLSDISAVNFMVGSCLFASKMNWSISSLVVSHRENTSSTFLFHSRGLILLLLIIYVSTADIKVLPELSRNMAYTTRNTVNNNLNPVVLELSKEKETYTSSSSNISSIR